VAERAAPLLERQDVHNADPPDQTVVVMSISQKCVDRSRRRRVKIMAERIHKTTDAALIE
jgi:hypothetical protein